ncbi:MAG: hypothetical protein WCC06_08695 [Candidatus Aminicenantales bacterium]
MKGKAALTIFLLCLIAGMHPAVSGEETQEVQDQIEKAKIFQDAYPLISETDLYCSFFILEEIPQIKIVSSERGEEKTMLSDSDIFYVDKGRIHGLETGQVFLIVEIGPKINIPGEKKSYGYLARKHGRASLIGLNDMKGTARVDKACGAVMIGNYLIPFIEKEGLLGKDLGYEVLPKENALTGRIVYLADDQGMIASGHWAIINLGRKHGIEVGRQMTIFKRIKEDLPREAVGNLIVIDVGWETSTVKILSCKEAIVLGHEVQVK